MPYFQWNPQAFAATYLIEVYKNGDTLFSPANKVLSATTKFSAWSPTTSLASGVYAWRVRRNDADNRPGPWSAGRTFTLQSAKPTLTAPANGATVAANTLLFTWGGVAGAVQYKIEVAATCTFSTILYTQTTVMTSWAPITAYANGSYCWRIKALDAAGNDPQHLQLADIHYRHGSAAAADLDYLRPDRSGPAARLAVQRRLVRPVHREHGPLGDDRRPPRHPE